MPNKRILYVVGRSDNNKNNEWLSIIPYFDFQYDIIPGSEEATRIIENRECDGVVLADVNLSRGADSNEFSEENGLYVLKWAKRRDLPVIVLSNGESPTTSRRINDLASAIIEKSKTGSIQDYIISAKEVFGK
jgi:hypothetical protein